MFDLKKFPLSSMVQCGSALRVLGENAESMEHVAQAIVAYLYRNLGDGESSETGCALVRFYVTERLGALPDDLQQFASERLDGHAASPNIRCLTLLATAGDEPQWNDRRLSRGHRAIPLPSQDVVESIPMISGLLNQCGFPVSGVIRPHPELVVDIRRKQFNVFYVPEAAGSPYIPAQQDFVVPYGIRSSVGFGGMLPNGHIYVVILFSKVHVTQTTAQMFQALALNVKMAVLPCSNRVFALEV